MAEDTAVAQVPDHTQESPVASREWIWFLLQLALVWIAVWWTLPGFAGRYYEWILPLYQHPPATSYSQFLFSHVLEFSFIPAFIAGAINSTYRHRSAQFIWIVPMLVLIYKLLAFPHAGSVLRHSSKWWLALHHYFGRDFNIGEWHGYRELFELAASNPDLFRGMDQIHFTGPFYGAVAYSLATALFLRTHIGETIRSGCRQWYRREVPAAEKE